MENQRWEETDLQIPSSFVEKKNKLDSQIISPLCEKYKPQKSVKTIGITPPPTHLLYSSLVIGFIYSIYLVPHVYHQNPKPRRSLLAPYSLLNSLHHLF